MRWLDLGQLGREAAVTGAATGSGCEPRWAGALRLSGPGLGSGDTRCCMARANLPGLSCAADPPRVRAPAKHYLHGTQVLDK